LIDAEPRLKPVAPTSINIVCYRYQPAGVSNDKLKAINTEIMLRLQEEGTAIIRTRLFMALTAYVPQSTIIEPATMI
jgi:glutamate/tyrosine decarboxylase-like PLP-dependent enzyme